MGVPRGPQPILPHGGLIVARGLELLIPQVLLVGVGDAREDGDGVAFVQADVPPCLMEIPEVVVDLLADLGGQFLEEGRCRLAVGRRSDTVPELLRHA